MLTVSEIVSACPSRSKTYYYWSRLIYLCSLLLTSVSLATVKNFVDLNYEASSTLMKSRSAPSTRSTETISGFSKTSCRTSLFELNSFAVQSNRSKGSKSSKVG